MLKKIKIFLFLLFLCKIEHIFTFFYNTHIQSLDPALNCAQEPRVSTMVPPLVRISPSYRYAAPRLYKYDGAHCLRYLIMWF